MSPADNTIYLILAFNGPEFDDFRRRHSYPEKRTYYVHSPHVVQGWSKPVTLIVLPRARQRKDYDEILDMARHYSYEMNIEMLEEE